MIEVSAVSPTAHETRAFKRGWGLVHWTACLAAWTWMIGLLAVWIVTSRTSDGGRFEAGALAVIAAIVAQTIASKIHTTVSRRVTRTAPGGLACDWKIDEAGMHCRTPLAATFYDWRGIKDVLRESDRFLFLLSPAYNASLPLRCMTAEQISELETIVAEVRASGRLGAGVD